METSLTAIFALMGWFWPFGVILFFVGEFILLLTACSFLMLFYDFQQSHFLPDTG
jgi:hypothetical protein